MAVQYKMEVDLSKCVGCGTCSIACKHGNNTSDRYKGDTFNWADIAVKTTGFFPNTVWEAIPTLCNHCENPRCVAACPVAPDANGRKAIFKDTATGIVMHNNDRCIHCYQCKGQCPYSASASDILMGYSQYSVISVNTVTPHDRWNNTTAVITDCTATPAQVVTAVGGAKPPYGTKWTHVETVGTLNYNLYDVRSIKKPEKCYYCYHRLKDITLGGTENVGERRPYCVLACPSGARNIVSLDGYPVGARVLKHMSPANLQLVDAATFLPTHSKPQTYYIGNFSQR